MSEAIKKRKDLSLKEKRDILECYDKLPKMSQRNAAVHLKISQPVLCKILKNRLHIESLALKNENMDRKRTRSGKNTEVDSALKTWFNNVRERKDTINGPLVRQKAEELAKILGKEDFMATDGWLQRWKKRENIEYKRIHGEEKSGDFLSVEVWIKTELPKIIAKMTESEICQAIAKDNSKPIEESEASMNDEEENSKAPPTNAEMQEALRTLRRGVQHSSSNFQKHYEYEQFIQEVLSKNRRQTM